MVYLKIEDSFLDNRLEKALARITQRKYDENSPVFIEICNCPGKGGQLFYNETKKEYFGKGFCNKNLLCYRIQRDKHSITINQIPKAYETLNLEEELLDKKQKQIDPQLRARTYQVQ
ncbi:MAG: hypothetical protein ACTSQE_03105 [Candidatus Heimdallarchaeaceae archaeon]